MLRRVIARALLVLALRIGRTNAATPQANRM